VRGLSCVVKMKDHTIVIDPGVALGYQRYGLLPHPVQIAVGEEIRRAIMVTLKDATDIVISHFHGDHVPLVDANPYQLKAQKVAGLCQKPRLWAKGPEGLSYNMRCRIRDLGHVLNRVLPNAERQSEGPMEFSGPMPHGKPRTQFGTVMMTRIKDGDDVFVHASDIQLLNSKAVSQILNWYPSIVLAGGPPIYLSWMSYREQKSAWNNALQLAKGVNTLILDHHLLRCEEGLSWLNRLSSRSGHRVICAADFMKRPRCLLEARRRQLYREMPVPDKWHENYAHNNANTQKYRDYARKRYKWFNY